MTMWMIMRRKESFWEWGDILCLNFTHVFVYLYLYLVFLSPCGGGWGSSEEIGHWASPPTSPSPPIPL